MAIYLVHNTISGIDLGCYQGATPDEAIRAMLTDAGCGPDVEAGPDVVAIEQETGERGE